jgi:VIT1/CCC1 family predicted Fe2+/Mn2+ transporter
LYKKSIMKRHSEFHRSHRIGWLRAAVLGANDGIVSTASLVIGVTAGSVNHQTILLSGFAGLIAGAMSMAAGEYVSVSTQSDTENADLAKERMELATDGASELKELTGIYVGRGLTPDLAHQVALQLTAHDALGAHARDELGITEIVTARPVQAAFASAGSFAIGAALPLAVALLSSEKLLISSVGASSLLCLAVLGGVAAKVGGAKLLSGAMRMTLWGALAMMATAAVGHLFGTAIG